jgi:hypothetical protein
VLFSQTEAEGQPLYSSEGRKPEGKTNNGEAIGYRIPAVSQRRTMRGSCASSVCWTFVALTLLTLIALFVWHFNGGALAWFLVEPERRCESPQRHHN